MRPETAFFDERRILHGPWQAFERDVARLLLANAFEDVRLVGGTGDKGADVLGTKHGQLWVFQCKYTSTSPPPVDAIAQAVEAARYYKADRIVVATSRPPGEAFIQERLRLERTGLRVEVADPATILRLMSETPEYPHSRRNLHQFQDEVASRFREALTDTGRAQIVLATGLGKTVIMAEVVADLLRDGLVEGQKVLVLAHTRALVDQLQRNFWFQLPKWVATHRLAEGERPAFWEGVTFGTVQSAISCLGEMPKFGLILVDEAHHIGAASFRDVLQGLSPRMQGGVTATPWRGDGYDIDQLLGPPIVKIGISEGLQRGYLSETDYRLLADNIDWAFVQRASRHRYSLTQLNRMLLLPTRDDQAARIVKEVFTHEQRRAGIVFSPTILHAETFAGMLRHYGLRAEAISSGTPARNRDIFMSRFRGGYLDLVATVDLFNEGVDVPDVDLIVFMRATHSRRIFVQQLGRGLRITPTKDKVVVLDFVTDLRRIAEVIDLDKSVRCGEVERLGLGEKLISFTDRSAGTFLREWMLDQASLFLRIDEPHLELPELEFPSPLPPGGVQ